MAQAAESARYSIALEATQEGIWDWNLQTDHCYWSPIVNDLLGLPVGVDYLALVIAGVLIVIFSVEHIIALLRGKEVEPSWH